MNVQNVIEFEKLTGKVISFGSAQDPSVYITETTDVLVGSIAVPGKHYVKNGKVHTIPEQLSKFHNFDWNTKTWVPDAQYAWEAVINKRNDLLIASDWVVTKATERNESVSAAWMEYRQALRDITQQADPWNLVWPELP